MRIVTNYMFTQLFGLSSSFGEFLPASISFAPTLFLSITVAIVTNGKLCKLSAWLVKVIDHGGDRDRSPRSYRLAHDSNLVFFVDAGHVHALVTIDRTLRW